MIEEYLREDEGYTLLERNNLILTSNGRVFKQKTDTEEFIEIPKSVQDNYEYMMLKAFDDNIYRFYIHDLVYLMFKGFFDLRYFRVVHKNGDTLDNSADNLEIKLKEEYIEKYGNIVNSLDGTILIME